MNFDECPHGDDFFVSDERNRMDMRWTVDTLLGTYWGSRRTHDQITDSIRNSLCFGLYEHTVSAPDAPRVDRQIGFCRVVSDFTTFTWLCDVVIDEAYRKRGLGKFLCETVMRDHRVRGTVILLRTRTADMFYRAMGFTEVQALWRIPKN